MAELIKAIRGMNDILPHQTQNWRYLEQLIASCMTQYGYQEIRLPHVESTQLFKRSIGEVTDIVEKEMYTFTDLNGDSLTLRPEGTASCIRACLEHGLLYNQQQKLWYLGAMFRHEKPQKGRYRQFTQFGIEALGYSGVVIELELIAICYRLWKKLHLSMVISLEINTIGTLDERRAFKKALVDYLTQHVDKLDSDSQRRLTQNPLRILDSKQESTQAILIDAPKLNEFLGAESKAHFNELCEGLELLKIPYTINPCLVRGLDYYGHTVFEWVTDQLGSQGTVCAGGRYDILVEQLGGKKTPAVGLAIGMERLLLLMDALKVSQQTPSPFTIYMICDKSLQKQALFTIEKLHDLNADWQVILDIQSGSFKNQFKRADKSGASLALVLGEDEWKNGKIGIKNLVMHEEQITISLTELESYLINYLDNVYLGDQ